jgi:hypothetical protein
MNYCLDNFEKHFYASLMTTLGEDMENSLEVKIQIPFRKGIFTGVIDVMAGEGIWADWKTGTKVPSDEQLMADPQAAIYYWLAKSIGITPPRVFNYVYLVGKPMGYKTELYKSGPRKGEPHRVIDEDNPMLKFTFPVFQDDSKMERVFNDYVNPLAEILEHQIYYKNISPFNCNNCSYRTACSMTTLPKREEYE